VQERELCEVVWHELCFVDVFVAVDGTIDNNTVVDGTHDVTLWHLRTQVRGSGRRSQHCH